jgi:asparagine synthase (glutamine-hydrolysing)
MCGICGIIGARDPKIGQEAVETMVRAMTHRGPDDSGIFQEGSVVLGMARLSIQDLSDAGHQPMSTPDGMIWIVYNGELYNVQSERRALEAQGVEFRSNSDTEVVLRLYERYGDDFLLRLRGIFALAIHDMRGGPGKARVLLARDHFGIKPLLFGLSRGRLLFASELKAILASGLLPAEVDPVALRQLLTYGSVYQPRSFVKGVSMLPPAHRLLVEGGKARMERYWRLGLDRRPGLRTAGYEEQRREMYRTLEDTLQKQLISDVPVGAFLSGGIDSCLLVALMSQTMGQRVKTFSVGFGPEFKTIDETDLAQSIAKHLGTEHTRVEVSGAEVAARVEDFSKALDQPSIDGFNSYLVSSAAAREVTVAISGTGADDVFIGYPWFVGLLRQHPRGDEFLSRFGELQGGFHFCFGPKAAARLLDPGLREAGGAGTSYVEDLRPLDELPDGTIIERASALTLRGYTNNQLLRDIDAVSMDRSLEVRVPYLDPEVVDTVLSLPDEAKLARIEDPQDLLSKSYRESGIKRILIDVGLPLLPEGYGHTPKRGFGMPLGPWLQGPLKELCLDALSDRTTSARGLFDPQAIRQLRARFVEGKMPGPRAWLLLMVELWSRHSETLVASSHRDKATARPPLRLQPDGPALS